ncbi:hypothetical protein SERLA73DRAFT_138396 [Serpula lacrymans var. lacrymans S7.3]|uniref:Probable RNA polymerase II nuclear localization protein SLC7A6OS n=2 Tax=Serpula lacrymans var. lacrymans TaxID=341189 RepID=F8Q1E6_SERL3|nr:uncharacterized protein SERLADRAFT_392011 [Serpula lacrymans var. lacrymans S7.9]EGN98124.1 hypothetical protein SERLA73DRAFT_138396 [Serpula lacrymans var. lacrymans S7.3]EGO23705.1 hypothetical protein SERLADRAFT_392011 [Serpula lacrymans var. lacrymans S7.9]
MDTTNDPKPYTILRIKRKRTDEPLDALVVESRVRRKRSRGGIDVFQFAQTIEQSAWKDEQIRLELQNQISKLREKPSERQAEMNTATSVPQQKDNTNRRYTVLPQEESDSHRSKFQASPPKVLSAKDVPPPKDFRMYDAVLADKESATPAFDSEMEKFLPMLNDYLNINDISITLPPVASSSVNSVSDKSESGDYVWDVFYRRPATLSEWNSAANVGTLMGLPSSATNASDSESGSEEEDEADEDSNAEEYYKNDYPDEEDPSDSDGSDEFHEDSEDDDYTNIADEGQDWR